jgi:hypothetical protein
MLIGTAIYEQFKDRIIFAISVDSVEWLGLATTLFIFNVIYF